MLGHTSEVSYTYQNKERRSYPCMSANSFWGTAQQHVDPW